MKFKATLLKGDSKHECFPVNIAEFLRSPALKNIAFIQCYFNTINLLQSVFCKTYSFKILVSERNYKHNLTNH